MNNKTITVVLFILILISLTISIRNYLSLSELRKNITDSGQLNSHELSGLEKSEQKAPEVISNNGNKEIHTPDNQKDETNNKKWLESLEKQKIENIKNKKRKKSATPGVYEDE